MPFLYQIPRESRVYCECEDGSHYLTFHHLDGGYSLCTTEKGGIAHLYACAELVKVDDGYRLVEKFSGREI